ncbi:MAG: pilus assembly protein [Firmicutes bacterium]|nr:pilus assembly protein [Bacillota bacterium]
MRVSLLRIPQKEQGQAIVELALVLPVLLLVFMGIIQFGIIMSGQIAVTSAARDGARIAAVGASDTEVTALVEDALSGSVFLKEITIHILPAGTRIYGQKVKVQVEADTKTIVPFMNKFLGESFSHASDSTMRVEYVLEGS